MRKHLLAPLVLAASLLSTPLTTSVAAAAPISTQACSPTLGCHPGILNNSWLKVGMIHNRDGVYSYPGKYDAALPALPVYTDTYHHFNWTTGAAGFYMGSDKYAATIESWNGSAWVHYGTANGPGQVWLGKTGQWRVNVYEII